MMSKNNAKKFNDNLSMLRRMCLYFLFSFVLIGLSGVAVYSQEIGETELTPVQKKRQMIQEAKENINGTVWTIKLRRTGEGKVSKKENKENDILRFENYKVQLEGFKKDGFEATNYTVRLKGRENEIVIWETMQTSEDKGVAFCRGEIRDGKMRGVISWHISDKNKKEYSFISTEKDETIQSSEEVKEPVKESVKEPVKESVKEPVKESVKEPVKESVKEPVKEQVKESVKESVKEPVKEKQKSKKKKRWF